MAGCTKGGGSGGGCWGSPWGSPAAGAARTARDAARAPSGRVGARCEAAEGRLVNIHSTARPLPRQSSPPARPRSRRRAAPCRPAARWSRACGHACATRVRPSASRRAPRAARASRRAVPPPPPGSASPLTAAAMLWSAHVLSAPGPLHDAWVAFSRRGAGAGGGAGGGLTRARVEALDLGSEQRADGLRPAPLPANPAAPRCPACPLPCRTPSLAGYTLALLAPPAPPGAEGADALLELIQSGAAEPQAPVRKGTCEKAGRPSFFRPSGKGAAAPCARSCGAARPPFDPCVTVVPPRQEVATPLRVAAPLLLGLTIVYRRKVGLGERARGGAELQQAGALLPGPGCQALRDAQPPAPASARCRAPPVHCTAALDASPPALPRIL
jgi:hypothetical protein